MKMISFDTENDEDGNLTLCDFYDGEIHFTFDYKKFDSQREMREKIIQWIFDSDGTMFVAHNLEYDLVNIFYPDYLFLLEMYYKDALLFAKIRNIRKKFIDSFLFSFSALKGVGKQIGKEKIDTDDFYNIEYVRRDSEIVYEYMDQFIISVETEFDLKISNTLAGTAQTIFLRKFDRNYTGGKNCNEDYLNAYYGGRTECFKIGQVDDYIFEIDINSSYPTAMQNLFPTDEGVEGTGPEGDFWIAMVEVEIGSKVDIPILAIRTDKLIFPTGKFTTWINSVEYNEALRHAQLVTCKFLRVINFYESDYTFKKFINYFYTKRLEAKENRDDFKSNFYKLIMNSTYGRFAVNGNMEILGELSDETERKINETIGFRELEIESNKNKNYIIPTFITAYARIQLYNLFVKVKNIGGEIIYTDTDSCHFTLKKKFGLQDKIEYIRKNIEIDSELGNYSLKVYTNGAYYNVKAYMLETFEDVKKYKCKGVKESEREHYFEEGFAIVKKPVRLRQALVSIKGLRANEWREFRIENKGEYKKRVVIKPHAKLSNTLPIHF